MKIVRANLSMRGSVARGQMVSWLLGLANPIPLPDRNPNPNLSPTLTLRIRSPSS